jgi:hypothetical protein
MIFLGPTIRFGGAWRAVRGMPVGYSSGGRLGAFDRELLSADQRGLKALGVRVRPVPAHSTHTAMA